MIKQLYYKRRNILRGLLRTYVYRERTPYEPETWWDNSFYTDGIADRKTITRNKNELSALHHYASMELILLRYFFNHRYDPRGWGVFDVGSGAGHWIDFYRRIGAAQCTGIDISRQAVEFLQQKYASEPAVEIHCGLFHEFLTARRNAYDVVNAIGVMFHVTDDHEWQIGLSAIANVLKPGGLLVVGEHFGFTSVNVQFHQDRVWKRLRSRAVWRHALRELGFREICLCYNPAYLFLKDWQPENNVLVARK